MINLQSTVLRQLTLCLILPYSCALTFNAAMDNLHKHPKVKALAQAQLAQEAQSEIVSSWQDPSLQASSTQIKTPQTNFKIGIMQMLPLTHKYKHFKQSMQASSTATHYRMLDAQRQLQKQLWQVLIALRQFEQTKAILQSNRDWILKALEVSKRLYANGKIEQRALLDIDLRRAELDSNLLALAHRIKEQQALLAYLCDTESSIAAIPWETLAQTSASSFDYSELALQTQIKQAASAVKALSLARIPDVQLSASYAQMDGMPMFGVMLSVPLPISKKHNAKLHKARAKLEQAKLNLTAYHKLKTSKLKQLMQLQEKITGQLQILRTDMLQLASNSKHLAFVSYKLANLTYSELLAAELKLQRILLEQVNLQAQLAMHQLQYKYLSGEKLYD